MSLILLAVYFLKGIYPFGGLTIIYSDMAQGYIPLCYHIYDVVHNGKSILWDPFLGVGSNMLGVENFSGMLSPISWLVAFSSREGIVYFSSFMLMIRMALMATAALVFINSVFKNTPNFWKIALSVMYAFSGYVLILYTNMMWLDVAILFPLLMLTLKNLLEKDKLIGYIVVLSLSLLASFYLSYMVLIFVFFGSGVMLWFYVDKTRRRKAVFSLGIGTVTSLLLTSIVTIPAYIQSSTSARAEGFNYANILASPIISISYKAQYFLFAGLALVIIAKIIMDFKKGKDGKKAIWIVGLLLLLTLTQVIFESVNLIWHTGKYIHFPVRFGFIPVFIIIVAAAYVFNKKDGAKPFKGVVEHMVFGAIALGLFVSAVMIGTPLGAKINTSMPSFGIDGNLTLQFFFTTLLFGGAIWFLLKVSNVKIKYILLGLVLLTEIFMHSMWYVGVPPQFSGGAEESVSWIYEANDVRKGFNIDVANDNLTRYKDVDSVLNSNYPLVIGAPAVSTWIHMIDAKQQDAFKNMGYSIVYTRILDTGGTLFSDMVLNANNYLTKLAQNNQFRGDMFGPAEGVSGGVGEASGAKGFLLYRNKHPLHYGLQFAKQADLGFSATSTIFDNQNFMYRTLFGKTDDIIKIAPEQPSRTDGSLDYTIDVKGEQYLYIDATASQTAVNFVVQGKRLLVPTLGDIENVQYPATFNSGLINLGLFKDSKASVRVLFAPGANILPPTIGMLPTAKLIALADSQTKNQTNAQTNAKISGNRATFSVNAGSGGKSFFIPINYDAGWSCKINGSNVPVNKAFGTFISVDLAQGANAIELTFTPVGFNLGLMGLGAVLLLGGLGVLIPRRYNFYENKLLLTPVYFIFWPVYIGGLLFVYVVPIGATLLGLLKGG
ncbi:MAG: YfhO family protein [Bacillota bacterium]